MVGFLEDLRHLDRRLALGRNCARHAPLRRQPAERIAGVYVLFDVAAIAMAPRVLAMFDRLRRLPPASPLFAIPAASSASDRSQ